MQNAANDRQSLYWLQLQDFLYFIWAFNSALLDF